MQLRYLLLLSVFSGWAALVQGTTCPTNAEYCQATASVTATCTTSKCVCNPTTLTEVAMGGCADLTVLPTPVVDAGVYSGEVLVGQGLTMTCTHAGYTGTVAYSWQEGGSDVGGETAVTYVKTAAAGNDVQVTCKITDGAGNSKTSANFRYLAYAAGGTIDQKPTVAIKDGFTAVATGGDFKVECRNRPVSDGTPAVGYTLDGGTTSDAELTVSSLPQAAVTCTLQKAAGGSETLSNANSDAYTVPITAFTPLADLSSTITGATSPVTIDDSTSYSLTCGISPAGVALGSLAVAYQWKSGGSNIAGATSATYDLQNENVGTHSITCVVSLGAGPTALTESSAISVTVEADNTKLGGAMPILYPQVPLVGGYVSIKCAVFVKTITVSDLTFSWTYDTKLMAGQSDHTLQINGLVDATHGNGKVYACTASKPLTSKTGSAAVLNIATTIAAFQPSVVSSKTTTNYGISKSYTLYCDPGTSYWIALKTATYEWEKAGSTVSGASSVSYSITASTTSTDYKCRVKIAGTFSAWSAAETVLAKAIENVAILGPTAPIRGQKGVWKCEVTATGTVTYKWQRGSPLADITGVTSATTQLYEVSSVSATEDVPHACVATVSGVSETSASVTFASVTTNPQVPVITSTFNNNHLNKGGTYVLTCTTASDPSQDSGTSTTYVWKSAATGGALAAISGETSQTYTISGASTSKDYGCTVTIGSGTADSATLALTVASATGNGRYCTASGGAIWTTVCFSDRKKYSGNCIDERCECAPGATLGQDDCTIDGTGGAYLTVASLFTLCIGMLMTQFFR